ncbi:DegT/DnrJ/EryC1/StrS family aminotransferase [Halanaerobacter jeridensis]|uniref:dTDP-4-amino-4,6-dideoxygalactose transaminase n=1 Tax=Halanaerobacter jeridensis TaxID=706427 RepID=A0A938XSX5_9FIRM|nr:DegT/DnrJ/EryC1/StrS family aminotransferase [Halanaerobacter jeridensis]MBM7556923.1 dTDP-4-amino-4,6-dideoxygalactose transaminase [Halanaerobacter jeridensis]
MSQIPFMDLSDCYNQVYDEIMEKIGHLIDNTRFIGGEEVNKFEEEFAEYCNTEYCIGCGNGTDALVLALRALEIGQGDKVITVPNTFIATAEAVTNVGAKVDFVDVEEDTYTMDPEKLQNYLKNQDSTDNIKAIIPVHLYGQMANMEEIMKIAREYGLKVIEDSAQAHGAELNGKRPGEYGDIATFSFYPGKNLGAFGDAGALVTNNEGLYKKVKMLANHGRLEEKYKHRVEGYNSRLDSIQAAVLRVKLNYLEEWTEERIKNAKYYDDFLTDKEVVTPVVRKNARHVYHLYVVRANKRDELRNELSNEDISTGIHYPIPLHLQPAYEYLGYKEGEFPISENVSEEIISLPMWPELSNSDIKEICSYL